LIEVKLTSLMVNDQDRARRFYNEKLGFAIKYDIPMDGANWLTLIAPEGDNKVELLLEPTGHAAAQVFQEALYKDGIPLTQLYTDDIHAEYRRLKELGVVFRDEPKAMGPVTIADFDDTCGNLIRLIEE